jgi:FG-GAP-like repeat
MGTSPKRDIRLWLIDLLEPRRVLTGAGELPLFPARGVSAPADSYSIVVDLDGDAKLDLVTVGGSQQFASPTVEIRKGDGRGGFAIWNQAALPFSMSRRVAAGDLTGDGLPDLVVVQKNLSGSDQIVMLPMLNASTATFGAAVSIGTANSINTVTIADVTGDSRNDLVIGRFAGIDFYPGNNNGTFNPVRRYAATLSAETFVTVSDVDTDGLNDMVYVFSGGTAVVAYTRPNGTHQLVNSGATALPQMDGAAPVVADFNGDGAKDVMGRFKSAQNGIDNFEFRILLKNPGNRNFTASSLTFTVPHQVTDFEAADINGDTLTDIVVAGINTSVTFSEPPPVYQTPSSVAFLLRPDATFSSAVPIDSHGMNPTNINLADLTGDGRPDLIANCNPSGHVVVVANTGSGQFVASPRESAFGAQFSALAGGDLNNDGFSDVVLTSQADSNIVVYLRTPGNQSTNTSPRFTATQFNVGGPTISVWLRDVNNDQTLDLITTLAAVSQTQGLRLAVGIGNGDGTFGTLAAFALPVSSTFGSANPGDIETLDLDGDGDLDIVASDRYSPEQFVLTNNGSGAFSVAAPLTSGFRASAMDVGDLNGDGLLDLVMGSALTQTPGNPPNVQVDRRIAIRLGQPGGGLAMPQFVSAPEFVGSVQINDIDGNGSMELITYAAGVNVASNVYSVPFVQVYSSTANGYVESQRISTSTEFGDGALIRDMNSDGHKDIVIAGYLLGGALIIKGQSNATFAVPEFYAGGGPAAGFDIADVDQDNKPDIIIGNLSASGNVPGFLPNSVNGISLLLSTQATVGFVPLNESRSFNVDANRVEFNFDIPIDASSVTPGDLLIDNLTSPSSVVATSAIVSSDGKRVSFNLPMGMSNGRYRFSLAAGAVVSRTGTATTQATVLDGPSVFVMQGDATRDGRTDFADLVILARNFNQSPRTYTQGDFNFDGTVNFADLVILARNFNSSLPPLPLTGNGGAKSRSRDDVLK